MSFLKQIPKAVSLLSNRKNLMMLKDSHNVDLTLLNSKLKIETSKYVVKVATNLKELKQVFRLRYEVFHMEYASKKIPFGADRDIYDHGAYHFIVKSKANDKVVGYYRFILAEKVEDFYSHSEYNLAPLLKLDGKILELSRACIHQDYRNGNILSLIWRGLMRFSQINDVRYWFGIPSLKSDSVEDVAGLYEYFVRNGYLHSDVHLSPHKDFELADWLKHFDSSKNRSDDELEKLFEKNVPALVKLYMRAGTKFIGIPAYDKKFKCYDFCTLIDVTKMNSRYQKKYAAEGVESANRIFDLT